MPILKKNSSNSSIFVSKLIQLTEQANKTHRLQTENFKIRKTYRK